MTSEYGAQFWATPKSKQKELIQIEIREWLYASSPALPEVQRYFLHEALCHLYAGRYELACRSLDDVYVPPKLSAGAYSEIMKAARSITCTMLVHTLRYIEGTPTRDYAVFR
jgi:hypothetical protein